MRMRITFEWVFILIALAVGTVGAALLLDFGVLALLLIPIWIVLIMVFVVGYLGNVIP